MHGVTQVGTAIVAALGLAFALAGCSNDVETKTGCHRGGERIAVGTTFDEGCNSCVCGADERITCEPTDACIVCTHDGQGYQVGESYPAGDGCNICQCAATGESQCTTAACGVTCTYDGEIKAAGSSFPAVDGCNTCTCGSDGAVSCTELACPCDPPNEWWRDYAATDPETCAVIDYDCPPNTEPFENACGCGCEQSAACEQTYDCSNDACDPAVVAVECPYSEILE